MMNRNEMLQQIESTQQWDIIIIGGGATGLGAALDAAERGYKTLLLEQCDFAKGTSSRSTKLVHGGVRYLAQGNIKLVVEALKERGRLLRNAPHITSAQSFVLPVYKDSDKWYYGIGLRIYDILSGSLSLGKTKILSKQKAETLLPSLKSENIKAAIQYFDGQFDDTRLAIDIASTAVHYGATVLNYAKVIGFKKKDGKIISVDIRDELNNIEYNLRGKAFINATGVFTDAVMQMDEEHQADLVSPSQGIHLVIDKKFFNSEHALMIPKTDDGRVLFAVPWHNEIVVGTTELNTAVKPFAFDYFFNHYPESSTAIYFDPDILVYDQLIELEESFAENDIILTPHITKPIEDIFSPQETDFLNTGLYNLGFIALKKTQNSFNFLSWWMNRLKDHCRIDFLNGLFVDQLWINLVPLFFKKVEILRHPGYNMAYWNLHERKLSFLNDKYTVNESYPLIFFHFSGYKIDKPYALSIYQNRFNFISRPDLTELFIKYSKLISNNLHEEFSKIPCHYYSIEKKNNPTLEKKNARPFLKRNLSSLTNYCFFYLKNKF